MDSQRVSDHAGSLLMGCILCAVSGVLFTFVWQPITIVETRNSATDSMVSASQAGGTKHAFSAADEALLDAIQKSCFEYFWTEVGAAGLAKDRMKAPVASIASVGFQLSALPIGVERGWISRLKAEARAEKILKTLLSKEENRRFGLYYHYLDLETGRVSDSGYEVLVSTVDSALLIAGAIPAGEYFGGRVKEQVSQLVEAADWSRFVVGEHGLLCMGWRPDVQDRPSGTGQLHSSVWHIASDEERLLYFVATGAPDKEHALPPESYYALERHVKTVAGVAEIAVSPQGNLFQYFFSHCWIDYGGLKPDKPASFGSEQKPVDWFANSKAAVLAHRDRCIANQDRYQTLSESTWGLSPCVGRDGYLVPEVEPNLSGREVWGEGTVAPYAAGAAIMFTPEESMRALHAFRSLQDASGRPLIWRPLASGGYGLADAYNLDQGYVSDDYVGIDLGPLMLGIENARSGLVWKLFMQSETAKTAVRRLRLEAN